MSLKTAIIGSGNIGCDVLCKVLAHPDLDCTLVAGRSMASSGLAFARERGVATTANGVDGLFEHLNEFDLVFDATSAADHEAHASRLIEAGKTIINLTPAALGALCVPSLNGMELTGASNINMITCGGQASIPLAAAIARANPRVRYIEVVSSISAESAGPATRRNLSNYISTTENALIHFTGCKDVKAILNVNPAKPNVYMQTAVSALIDDVDLAATRREVERAVAQVQSAVPGYEVIVDLHYSEGRLFTMVRVEGAGHFLDPSAGNLDIITATATYMAALMARGRQAERAA
ncbi:acetaldehyde dehydrogenase (acetylating) [Pseudomonas frederiksbergensis]|uniref:acetaldehyde dehydrogenase (acetylating) n=1 Tax=Pseudomonas frederiksbergensis TaxID=104087 RepID=UPI003D19FDF0